MTQDQFLAYQAEISNYGLELLLFELKNETYICGISHPLDVADHRIKVDLLTNEILRRYNK